MKIFLAGPNWFGNLTEYCARALDRLGCDVKVFYSNKSAKEVLKDNMAGAEKKLPFLKGAFRGTANKVKDIFYRQLYVKESAIINENFVDGVLSFAPNIILILSCTGSRLLPDAFAKIRKKMNVPVAAWFGDDPFRFYQETRNILQYDCLFAGDPFLISQLKLISKSHVEFLPAAADPDIFKPVKLSDSEIAEFGCDIGFVGASAFGDGGGVMRAKILESISSYDLKIFGDPSWSRLFKDFPSIESAFQGRILPVQETNKLINASKIVMNIHHPQNKYWSSIRTFEIAASGAFQLADARKGIEDLLELNKEIVCYRSLSELKELVDYYLYHTDEAEGIAQRCHQKVLEKHTYLHRMKTILDSIEK